MSKDKAPRRLKKEFTDLQKAYKEIKMLKRQLSRLKKIISRMNIEDYNNIQEARAAQLREREELKHCRIEIDETAQWQCFSCGDDYLRLVIYHKVNEPYYLRRCPNCGNRTKGKKFDNSVKGVKPEG